MNSCQLYDGSNAVSIALVASQMKRDPVIAGNRLVVKDIAGPPLVVTTASMRPSLSISPMAMPRPTQAFFEQFAEIEETSTNFLPVLRGQQHRLAVVKLRSDFFRCCPGRDPARSEGPSSHRCHNREIADPNRSEAASWLRGRLIVEHSRRFRRGGCGRARTSGWQDRVTTRSGHPSLS